MTDELADLALEAARLAADLIRGRRADGVSVAATKTSDVDIVTEADRAAETLIRDTIRARRPDDAFLGEEGNDEEGTTGVRWVIDPIDGTVNFLYGLPNYAVSIAAERDGEAVAGVVLNVVTGTEYVARSQDGHLVALRDGRPIGVRGQAPLSHRLIATGFSYDREVRVLQAQAASRLLPHIRDLRRLGSCALDLCLVADGSLDGYVEEGVNLWDHAAGGLIARTAGATTRLGAGVGGMTLLVCGPAHGFEELHAAVIDAGFGAPVTITGRGE
ncbi:inositol monophosphatase family protein [Nocardioides sp.]|uniref:inositol monophosphatase family protein n=1 Tax=Nocardioides sp. TaxID=35761 RepID=UPI00286C6DAC|nr:inositol monophosphatase family protein [Nocardioides sp.]